MAVCCHSLRFSAKSGQVVGATAVKIDPGFAFNFEETAKDLRRGMLHVYHATPSFCAVVLWL